jgi:uncharacterized protein (DUF1810 family)
VSGGRGADPFDLQRFLDAQRDVYERALAELRAGRKRTHWMWFVFPQMEGLGVSETSRYYGIGSREEAAAYLEHPVLGPRLVQCAEALLALEGKSASQVFGYPDDLKLRSCLTLFADVGGAHSVFLFVLEKYYGGQRDSRTLELLQRGARPRG